MRSFAIARNALAICFLSVLVMAAAPADMSSKAEKAYKVLCVINSVAEYEKYCKDFVENLGGNFDLDTPEVSAFMLSKMNEIPKGHERREPPSHVLNLLVKMQKGKVFEWLLDNYGNLNAMGRCQLSASLHDADFQEACELLGYMLGDKEPTGEENCPDEAACFYRKEFRVCDGAYNLLICIVCGKDASQKALESLKVVLDERELKVFDTRTRIEARDISVAVFGKWWAENSAEVLRGKPSLSDERPSIRKKLDALLKKEHLKLKQDHWYTVLTIVGKYDPAWDSTFFELKCKDAVFTELLADIQKRLSADPKKGNGVTVRYERNSSVKDEYIPRITMPDPNARYVLLFDVLREIAVKARMRLLIEGRSVTFTPDDSWLAKASE